jgi:hypothetical protein
MKPKSFLLCIVALVGCVACRTQKISVTGELFEKPFSTNVCNHFAATMLANRKDSNIINFYAQYENAELNNTTLEKIAKQYSLDASTLFLIEKLYQQPANRTAQNDYLSNMADLQQSSFKRNLDFLKNYHVVFIPGFNYNSNMGNCATQRAILDSAKISCEMIFTDEIGLLNENAQIIAKRLREINKERKNIILVSVSKGGTETAIALSNLLKPEELSSVTAWLNVCGILRGTPVADYWAAPFRKMFLSLGLFFIGKGSVDIKAIMEDLSYERLKGNVYTIPKNIYTVSFLATSLGRNRNKIMKSVPNDGYSPLIDEVPDNSAVVVNVGTNHTLKGLNLDNCMIALLQHIVKYQKNKEVIGL